jgi:hypothetical protein
MRAHVNVRLTETNSKAKRPFFIPSPLFAHSANHFFVSLVVINGFESGAYFHTNTSIVSLPY